jgi:hypothetical protein
LKRADYHQIAATARNDWYLGLDVGQSIDPSAMCAMQHVVTPLEGESNWVCNDAQQTWKQKYTERFLVRGLERIRLQTPYPRQVEIVAARLATLERPTFVLDQTGCGRPVADMFERAGLRPKRISIHGGDQVTRPAPNTWNVPKQILISGLEARMHSGEFIISNKLTESDVLREELKDFRSKSARQGVQA